MGLWSQKWPQWAHASYGKLEETITKESVFKKSQGMDGWDGVNEGGMRQVRL